MRRWLVVLMGGLLLTGTVVVLNWRTVSSETRAVHGVGPAPLRTLTELSQQSEAAAVVSVLSVEAKYDPQNRLVITSSMVQVEKPLKGKITAGETFPVRVVGGKDGTKSTPFVESMLPLEVGSKQVLFLKWYESPTRPDLTGWALSGGYHARALIQSDGSLKAVGEDGPLHSLNGKPFTELEALLADLK